MDELLLSRLQFADTAAFHILWPMISIGTAFFMFIMEALWLWTKNEMYYQQVRFWTKIFILSFGVGVASGIPLQFQFGTNWATFSYASGDFFGNILGFESTVAFALESAFLAIFVFGWNRVGPFMHLFANAMVMVGATLSAFWIMAANSWMQIPRGVEMVGDKLVVTDYFAAVFNPGTLVSFGHMWVACIETTLFFMMGLSAYALLRKKTSLEYRTFFVQSFKYSLIILIIVAPLQIILGHTSGVVVKEHQPAKLAAMELHWETNPAGVGAPFNVLALPHPTENRNAFEIAIPNVLSLITTNSLTGEVQGLNDFPEDERPTKTEATLTYYAFRIMVAIGFIFLGFLFLGLFAWRKKWFDPKTISNRRLFLIAWILAIPLGFVATIAGWMTREIGRQPWIVYHIMRTEEGLSSNLDPKVVATTMGLYTLLFLIFIVFFTLFTIRIIRTGPNFSLSLPRYPIL